ncbi:MAG TPA: redoxin domain-containing protein [Synergistaceae bacterium]|nr:redoxin domain-containing protein [Synergistaceae bacterium]HPJ26814.1 redoxin domain-containing protein [Synergistaceae bacterium]HPQ36266.1 redoxin domain-containing protein [Synergistaceae bacterium]
MRFPTVRNTVFLLSLVAFFSGSTAWGAPFFASYDVTRHSDGEDVFLEDFVGSPAIVMFFYPNCEDCKEELQLFESMYEELRERGVVLLPITKERFNPRLVSKTLKDIQVEKVEVYYDHMPGLFESLPVRSVPRLLVCDASGNVVYDEKGMVSDLALEEALDQVAPRKGE